MADNALISVLTALLKHQVKKLVGEDALGVIGEELTAIGGDKLDEQVKALLGEKSTAEELEKAAVFARDNFRGKINDDEIEQWMVMLPLDNLPTITSALEELPTSPDESNLENALRETVSLNWKKLSSEQVNNAVNSYLFCLRSALLPIEKQTLMVIGRSVLRTEEKVGLLIQRFEEMQLFGQLPIDHTILNAKTVQGLFGVSAALVEIEKIKPATQERLKSFYQGDLLWWDIILADGDVERDTQKAIIVDYSSYPENIKMLCIAGEPGAGKSTLAWRVASNLSRNLVLPLIQLRDNESEDFWYLLENGINQYGKPVVVLVDDIFRNVSVTRALASTNPDTTVIIISTSRSNEIPDDLLLHFDVDFIFLPPPTSDEITRALEKANLRKVQNSAQLKKFANATTWLVLMYEMTTGEELSKRIHDSVKRLKKLDEVVYLAYEYICFAGQFDLEFPTSLLYKLDNKGRFFEIYKQPTANDLILQSHRSSNYLCAKHSIFAKFAYESYKRDPRLVAKEILEKIDYANLKERSFLTRLLLSLLDSSLKDFVKEILMKTDSTEIFNHSSCQELVLGWAILYEKLGDFNQVLLIKRIAYSRPIVRMADWHLMMDAYNEEPDFIPDFLLKANDWLKNDISNSYTKVQALKIIERRGGPEQITEAIQFMNQWLKAHPSEANIRAVYLKLVERNGSAEQIEEAMHSTYQWLKNNPSDGSLREFYLGHLLRNGSPEQIEEAISSTNQWLKEHPADTNVRAVYLRLVERKGRSKQIEEAIHSTNQWLKEHPSDGNVRTFHLGLLERNGSPEQIEEAISSTNQWLKEHPADTSVRAVYLRLVERNGSAEQIEEAILTTNQWLKDHPSEANIRRVYLSLVERKGSPVQIEEAILATNQWLKEHPSDIVVQEFYLGLVKRKGNLEQAEEAIHSTGQWLKDHPSDTNVRAGYLSLMERKGNPEQIEEAIHAMVQWLKDHPKDIEVRRVYLGLTERNGNPVQIEEAIYSTNQWLKNNPKDSFLRRIYLGLLERKGTSEQIEEAIHATQQWLKTTGLSKGSKAILLYKNGLLMLKLSQVDDAEKTLKEALTNHKGLVPARISLSWCLYKKGKKKDALQELKSSLWWSQTIKEYPMSDVYFQIGCYWYKENDYGFAKDFFMQAIQFCKSTFNPYKYYIELGRTLLILRDDSALKILQEAQNLIPENSVDKAVEEELDHLIEQAAQRK